MEFTQTVEISEDPAQEHPKRRVADRRKVRQSSPESRFRSHVRTGQLLRESRPSRRKAIHPGRHQFGPDMVVKDDVSEAVRSRLMRTQVAMRVHNPDSVQGVGNPVFRFTHGADSSCSHPGAGGISNGVPGAFHSGSDLNSPPRGGPTALTTTHRRHQERRAGSRSASPARGHRCPPLPARRTIPPA